MKWNSPWWTARSRTSSGSVSELTTAALLPSEPRHDPVWAAKPAQRPRSAGVRGVSVPSLGVASCHGPDRWVQVRQLENRRTGASRSSPDTQRNRFEQNESEPEEEPNHGAKVSDTSCQLESSSLRLPGSQPGFYCAHAHARARLFPEHWLSTWGSGPDAGFNDESHRSY